MEAQREVRGKEASCAHLEALFTEKRVNRRRLPQSTPAPSLYSQSYSDRFIFPGSRSKENLMHVLVTSLTAKNLLLLEVLSNVIALPAADASSAQETLLDLNAQLDLGVWRLSVQGDKTIITLGFFQYPSPPFSIPRPLLWTFFSHCDSIFKSRSKEVLQGRKSKLEQVSEAVQQFFVSRDYSNYTVTRTDAGIDYLLILAGDVCDAGVALAFPVKIEIRQFVTFKAYFSMNNAAVSLSGKSVFPFKKLICRLNA